MDNETLENENEDEYKYEPAPDPFLKYKNAGFRRNE